MYTSFFVFPDYMGSELLRDYGRSDQPFSIKSDVLFHFSAIYGLNKTLNAKINDHHVIRKYGNFANFHGCRETDFLKR